MGRNPKHLLPQMRLHKGSGHARVRINGTEHWRGPFGSPAAIAAYDRLIAEYLAQRRLRPVPEPNQPVPQPQAELNEAPPVLAETTRGCAAVLVLPSVAAPLNAAEGITVAELCVTYLE
jgi:hypothetical protein